MDIKYLAEDRNLTAEDFLGLVQQVWPGEYDVDYTRRALNKTINITAWYENNLVGCVRVLTDGYYFGTIPEILVAPDFQKQGIGSALLKLAWEVSPTSLFFGVQPGNEVFFERLGFARSMKSYSRIKPRPNHNDKKK